MGHNKFLYGAQGGKQSIQPLKESMLLCGWSKVEKYFEAMLVTEKEKLSWVWMEMTGCVLNWWHCWKRNSPNAKWWDFAKALLKKFRTEFDPDIPVWVQSSREQVSRKKDKVLEKVLEMDSVEVKTETKSELLA